jgi:hypothetical protein
MKILRRDAEQEKEEIKNQQPKVKVTSASCLPLFACFHPMVKEYI